TQDVIVFQLLEENIVCFVKNELKKIKKSLSPDYPQFIKNENDEVDEEQRRSREAFLKITVNFLRRMKQEELADCLQSKFIAPVCRPKLKSGLKKKFQCVFEGISKAGNPTLLNQIYTELYITEGGTGEVNEEHEVRQIETASRKQDRAETSIRQEDIFKPPPGRDQPIRTVMTKGVAGIGKTVLTQKFTLDWAEDKANQDIEFTFPFTFRELNVLKEKKFSLVELVHLFFTETKEAGMCSFDHFQVVFIFDGLDECRLPLDFHNTEVLTDPTESTSVDVLLTNLIRGKLLPSARLWITTRPAAANQIPPQCVDMVTEVRGFNDPQKEEYFRKRFRHEEQASRIISHIKTSRSLHIMCHIPVFCWITATVLEEVLKTREGGELPKTLTEMYIHFLVVQSKLKKVKYDGGAESDPHWSPETRKMIESLGKVAFEQLQKGNLIFYESDLTECGIDIRAASVYTGVFTQIFKEETGLYQDKVFCFVHLSVQEFLAALHVHLTFINSGVNLMSEEQTSSNHLHLLFQVFMNKPQPLILYQSAVDKALQSPHGHLDLFLRFLLGLSLQTNQTLLRGLVTQTGRPTKTNRETVQYIKKKISENLSPEKSINLLPCLNELNDGSLVEEIQQSLRSGRLSTDKLSPAQWSALVFILLSSEKDLDVFDLKKYSASEEALLRLLPVVKASNKDSGLKDVSHLVKSPDFRLETLRLSDKVIQASTEKTCDSVVKQSLNTTETTMDVSEDTKLDKSPQSFTPELKTESTKVSYRFRCPGPGMFQCSLTGLVFVVDQEAELLYNTVQWDESLLQSAGKMAAGPLFNIHCPEDAVCELHLPHCEAEDAMPSEGLLSVVHITDDGMSFLKPLEITDTHVIVKVSHLSAFGLVWLGEMLQRLLNNKKPICGQLLLFLRPPARDIQILDVFLMPSNLPLSEVAAQQDDAVYIKISSDCKLIVDQRYSVLSDLEDFKIQPESAEFYLNYGPNFFPTFEVFLTPNTETLTLMVKQEEGTEVWKRSIPLPSKGPKRETGQSSLPADDNLQAEERLCAVRAELIQRVSDTVLNQLLDKLLQRGVIGDAEMESARTKSRAEKAKDVIDSVRRKGREASSFLIAALCQLDEWLSRELSLR
ncbi:NLR family CARD domain-containing protein 3-like, partial [Echeneis naucrates]|uniref:NLR family CARD domain-containing protein 3-like n=1 Tax=Echeneis naucrates TaxID=173247 RepID=UPI00111461C5